MPDNVNFIEIDKLTDDVRYSIYYLMRCIPLVWKRMQYGYYDVILFASSKTGETISREGLLKLIEDELNKDKLYECYKEFEGTGLPVMDKPEQNEDNKLKRQPYGWLSPSGDFYKSEWGTHDQSAEEIAEKIYPDVNPECEDPLFDYREFLIGRGWALIHDPSDFDYIVNHEKPLTKKQKDFLYGYFEDMGMKIRAASFMQPDV